MTEQSSPVRSPCMGVCALDEKDLCIACRRSGMEIAEWGVLTNDQRREVIKKIERRYRGEVC
ncbi:DUF1289 domain-containing protein [Neptunomonas japonica]|uniref:DUF1289 domain-containing protein n=1 Tax=Neptunomonas japonica JAMM 1380 TaxID=1441457 RepID=A0A7R6PFX1_9GAMM|nr:DUF1289 domain-containing protein [Neptunomonas japonica]BBB28431.1 conserved hypothetical protein [Neptunomonas japonica JAMM 1380]